MGMLSKVEKKREKETEKVMLYVLIQLPWAVLVTMISDENFNHILSLKKCSQYCLVFFFIIIN